MNYAFIKAIYVILTSLGLAIVFNFLFFDKFIGVSVLIFIVIFLGAMFLLGLRERVSTKSVWWLLLPIIFFALMPSIRANEFLTFLNICGILGLLLLLTHEIHGTRVFLMRLRDYVILMTLVPLRMLGRALSTLSLVGQIHSSVKHHDIGLRVIKGVLMAVPVLIVFGVLFSQADLAFSQFVKGFVDITISERTMQYIVLFLVAFVGSLSFLSYVFNPKETQENQSAVAAEKSDGPVERGKGIEVMVFLGLISALFIVFIGFQITYLFGGESNIINAGFTYAEYARRGFFELLAAGILSLLVLLVSEKYARVESKSDKRFLIPALILIALVIIVIVSASKRLALYINAYSLTELRFYVAIFIMLLLVWFIILAFKFIKSKQEQFFAFGVLLSVIASLVAVNVINPDAFIARSNMEQYDLTGKVDMNYVARLSADAEPWKIELFKKLGGENKEMMKVKLQKEKDKLQKSSADWQSANISRVRALKLLEEQGI